MKVLLVIGILLLLFSPSVHAQEAQLLWSYKTDNVVSSVSISSDGSYIAAGSGDKNIYFFNREGKLLWSYKTGDYVWDVSVSSDGNYIAAGSSDNKVYFFNREGNLLWSYNIGNTGIISVSVSSDGRYIAAGIAPNYVYLLDRSGKLLWSYKTDFINYVISSVSISADGSYIATGDLSGLSDFNVYLLDRSGRLLWKYYICTTNSVSISSDGSYIAAGCAYNAYVYLLDRSGKLLWSYKTDYRVSSVSISSDGSYIAAGGASYRVYLLDRSGKLLWKYNIGNTVRSVSISSDGNYIAAGSDDKNVYFFAQKVSALPATPTPTTKRPVTTPVPATPPAIPLPAGMEISSKADIQTKVKDRIASTEKLLYDLLDLVSAGKKIGADVSEAEQKINSATPILKEANASYAAAIQKTNEGDLAAALRSGNEAYTKGSSGMTMLEDAKAPLHSAIKKKLNDNLASAESLVNTVKSIGLAGGAEEKLSMARDEIGKVDGAFNSGNLASAKEYILNADKLLGEIKTRVYSTFAGMTVFIGLLGVAAAKARTRITTRPKERKEDILKPAKVEVRRGVQLDPSLKALSISGLSKRYKNTSVLENVSFQLDQGKLCAIVGPSGGGKSTVVESLVGRITPDAGEIEILGKSVETQREEMNKLIGFVPQHPELYMDQAVWQNMMNSAIKWSVEDAEAKSEKILKMLGIYERRDVAAKNLSGGQLKRLSLGMELIREPPLLVLDEPTTGLDPTSRDQILSALSKVVYTDKKTAVFTTHFMDEAEHCDEVILVGNAKILAKGAPSELAKKMPGMGKIVQVTLEEVSQDMVSKISKIEGVKKVIREGRVLKIIMDSPEVVKISQKIEEFGGAIEESKIAKAGMKEVFVYYTGEYPEEAK